MGATKMSQRSRSGKSAVGQTDVWHADGGDASTRASCRVLKRARVSPVPVCFVIPPIAGMLALAACTAGPRATLLSPERHAIRVNQVGYLPDHPKVAVLCSLDTARVRHFAVETESGRHVLGPLATIAAPA